VFDIGFGEILICLVVALVIIGPEQLPGTVRTVSLWLGRLKRSLRETREEIERQIGAEDIRRQLHNEDIMRSLEQTRQTVEHAIMPDESEVHAPEQLARNREPSRESPQDQAARKPYGPPEELPDHAHGDTLDDVHGETEARTEADQPTDSGTPKS